MQQPLPDRGRTPEPLPKSTHPYPGEQLASLVERAARDHGTSVGNVLWAAGIDTGPTGGVPLWGVHMHPGDVERLAATLRTDPAAVADTLLSRYHGTLLRPGTLSLADGSHPHRLSRLWVMARASRCCPYCVDEAEGAWDVAWKVAGTAVCLHHQVLLADTCPACDTRLRQGDRGKPLPAYTSIVPNPRRCTNPSPHTSTGRIQPCGHHVTHIDVGPDLADHPRLLASQQKWQYVLDRNPGVIAGEVVYSEDWLRIIVEIAALVRKAADTGTLAGSYPDLVLEGWDLFQWERDRAREKGEAAPGYTSPPQTSAVAAVTVDVAVNVTDADTLADGLDYLIGAVEAVDPDGWRRTPETLNLGPELRVAWAEATKPVTGFTRVGNWMQSTSPVSDGSLRPDERAWPPLGAQHIPHLVDPLLYDENYKAMLPGTADHTGRAFVALCLARAVEGLRSWPQTAVALEFDADRAARIVDVCTRRVTDPVAWWEQIHLDVEAMRNQPGRYDYSEARWALLNYRDIGPITWKAICDEVGVLPGRTDARRRNATAFAWSAVTGGNPHRSPAFQTALDQGAVRRSLVDNYKRFVRWLSPEAGMRLAEHAAAVVQQHREQQR